MVDPSVLTDDILQSVAAVALPPLLWLFLYLFAWEDSALARSVGIGRLTFWLLLPGAFVGSIGNLPIFSYHADILAVNIGGGAVPVLLSLFLVRRNVLPSTAALAGFLSVYAAVCASLLALVVLTPSLPGGLDVVLRSGLAGPLFLQLSDRFYLALGICVAVPVLIFLGAGLVSTASQLSRTRRIVGALLSLTMAVLLVTFLTTAAVEGQGISSEFPYYLIAPVGVGVAAPLVANRLLRLDARVGLPIAYAAATLGVLIGADLLRQPPLYAGGPAALLAIGGAGPLDLLYLTGLLALASSYVTYRFTATGAPHHPPIREPSPPSPSPGGRLRRALGLALEDRASDSVRESLSAARDGIDQAALLTLPARASAPANRWEGLGVAPYVANDLRNLEALGAHPTANERDTARAFLTARFQVQIASEVAQRRFSSFTRRSLAFALDLLVVSCPAFLMWVYLARTLPGTSTQVLSSVPYYTSIFAYAAGAFLYFVIVQSAFGTTLGKSLIKIAVRDRSLGEPGLLRVLVRELPKLLPLTVLGGAGAVASLILSRGLSVAEFSPANGSLTLSAGAITLAAIAVLVVLALVCCALVSGGLIQATAERQRLGDYLAGTWVVDDRPTGPAESPPPPPPPAAAAPRS
ncbi:MAG: RDD family protein [Thermoplasmata archaeon]|nr:RDD family protein [Thermoplasmata archaeon]